jgi:hypothetical protein
MPTTEARKRVWSFCRTCDENQSKRALCSVSMVQRNTPLIRKLKTKRDALTQAAWDENRLGSSNLHEAEQLHRLMQDLQRTSRTITTTTDARSMPGCSASTVRWLLDRNMLVAGTTHGPAIMHSPDRRTDLLCLSRSMQPGAYRTGFADMEKLAHVAARRQRSGQRSGGKKGSRGTKAGSTRTRTRTGNKENSGGGKVVVWAVPRVPRQEDVTEQFEKRLRKFHRRSSFRASKRERLKTLQSKLVEGILGRVLPGEGPS